MGKKIFFTVTNDLSFDQRMHRICSSLSAAGYDVTLVGRKLSSSANLDTKTFKQKRLSCWFKKGKFFYAEYNTRLFLYLLFKKMDAICAIDLDTILPCLHISRIKKIPRIYDAHELFTELKEVITRPGIHRTWLRIEKKSVPKFHHGYTVSDGIAQQFQQRYGVNYLTIRNTPVLREWQDVAKDEKFLLYQGAVNEGRGFEILIPAMKYVRARLVVCGDGNFMPQLKDLIRLHQVEERVILKGMQTPEQLWDISRKAHIGIALAENQGLNQYLALPNKFFDYVHAGLPQLTMNYPEYRNLNEKFEVAVLLDDMNAEKIMQSLNNLLADDVWHSRVKKNCLLARQEWNWQQEEKKLIAFYQSVVNH